MANNGALQDSTCLVCNSNIENLSSCINIFCTTLSRNDELLGNFVLSVLQPSTLELNSPYICSKCYNLFQMLEQARCTATNIESEILTIYESSQDRRRLIKDKVTVNTNENQLFIGNLNIQNELIIPNNIEQLNNIQPLESSNNEYNILSKNQPTIIEDVNITNLQIIKTTELELNSNNSNTNETNLSLLPENSFNDVTNYNQTKLKLTNFSSYECNICTESFQSENDLEVHLLKHVEICSHKYEECPKQLSNLSDTNSHITSTYNEKEIYNINHNSESLEINTIGISNKEDCIDRKNNYKTLKNIALDNEITRSFIDNNNLDSDTDTSDIRNNQYNKEDESDKKNNTQYSKTAKISKYNSDMLNYLCSTCGKAWRTSSELKSHMKTHSSMRPFMCEKCGRTYKHEHALEIHLGLHDGISPYQCDICNKCFTQKGALLRHLPIHTGEMPYQCEVCGKRFLHHTSYNMHTLSHTGRKTYQCPNCHLHFLSASHLKRHMRVHTGEKPWSCPDCGKCFAERYNLYAHQRIHGTT